MPKALSQEEFEQRVKLYTNDSVKVIGKYQNRRSKIQVECKICGYQWNIAGCNFMPSAMSAGYSFSGCPECKYDIIKCSYCGKEIKRLKSALKTSSGYNYCSKECGNRHKNESTKILDGSVNYRRTAFELQEHKCAICGWDEDERVLEVHHIDENRNNNFNSNLIILCPICHKKLTLHLYTLDELLNK